MLDSHLIIQEIIAVCKHEHTRRKFLFRLLSQSLDLRIRRHMNILELLLLLGDGLDDPVASCLEKKSRRCIRNHIRYSHADALDRMNPYAHTAAADALAERHLPYLRVHIYLFSCHWF